MLHKYGCLLGVWKFDFNPYGGLVHIKVRSHCLLVAHVECVSVTDRLVGSRMLLKIQVGYMSTQQLHACTRILD